MGSPGGVTGRHETAWSMHSTLPGASGRNTTSSGAFVIVAKVRSSASMQAVCLRVESLEDVRIGAADENRPLTL